MCLMLCVSPNSNVYKKSYKFIHQSQINQFLNSHPLTTGDILNHSSLGLIIYILKLFLLFPDYKHCCNKLSCSPLYTSSIICLVCDAVVLNSCCQIALRKAGFIYTCHQHPWDNVPVRRTPDDRDTGRSCRTGAGVSGHYFLRAYDNLSL